MSSWLFLNIPIVLKAKSHHPGLMEFFIAIVFNSFKLYKVYRPTVHASHVLICSFSIAVAMFHLSMQQTYILYKDVSFCIVFAIR